MTHWCEKCVCNTFLWFDSTLLSKLGERFVGCVCKLDHFCCFDVFCSSVLSSFFVVIGSLPLCCEVER